MKNRKIYLEKNGDFVALKKFLQLIEENASLYILDLDGIEKDKPNLCTFQRLSSFNDLWVDFGPRNLGDIVDATMAGAINITLRKNLCPQLLITNIKEITNNKIYINIDFTEELLFETTDGLVNFNSREKVESDYKYGNYLKNLGSKNKIYTYESELKNYSYWKNFTIEGLLVDFSKKKEFKNAI